MVKGASSFKMVIPEEVEAKIRHLCNRVHDVEWSGTLFYKAEGSMENKDFKVICVDIFPMDIGTQGFTQYNESADVVSYMVEHPELLQDGIYQGLIHSHNNMPTFFSGTDTNTLISEGTDTVHFVSLIVNNAGKYTAGVTRRISKEIKAEAHVIFTTDVKYPTYNGAVVPLVANLRSEKDTQQVKKEEYIEWFNLDIEKAEVATPFEEIDTRLSEIRQAQTRRYTPSTPSYPSYGSYGGGYGGYQRPASYTPPTTPPNPSEGYKRVTTPSQNLTEKPVKEPTLFHGFGEMEELGYILTPVDAKLVESLALQLLTGSIFLPYPEKIDASQWVQHLDETIEKRFGSFTDGLNEDRWAHWLTNFIEVILDEPLDEKFLEEVEQKWQLETGDPDISRQILAYNIGLYLSGLPDSYCKNAIIEELETYLPYGIDDLTESASRIQ